jgi:hypothetical protein
MLIVTKQIISISLQTPILWLGNVIGSFGRPFNSSSGRYPETGIVWDGVLCMLGVYFVIVTTAALSKRLHAVWLSSTVALVLAAIFGYFGGYDSMWHGVF